jgi:large subunit ribosomal protein L10
MAAEVRRTAHLPEWKVKEVNELVERIGESKIIGIVGMREIPASDLQEMRRDLRSEVEVKMVRNSIARRALESSSDEMRPLADYIEDQTALIFSNGNPFKLYSLFENAKRPMAIRAGSKAPKDIIVEAGETSFSPGPMVGKLQAAGIPAAIKGGKVVINQKITIAKEGEVVSAKTADILKTMEIFPKKVGLELRAVYEGGLVFSAKDLAIDIDGLLSEIGSANARAFNFAVEIGYATPQTIAPMLQKASIRAKNLVAEAAIPVPGMMEIVISRAAANAKMLSNLAEGEAAPAQAPAKEEEKPKEEEKKEDAAAGLGSLFG